MIITFSGLPIVGFLETMLLQNKQIVPISSLYILLVIEHKFSHIFRLVNVRFTENMLLQNKQTEPSSMSCSCRGLPTFDFQTKAVRNFINCQKPHCHMNYHCQASYLTTIQSPNTIILLHTENKHFKHCVALSD